MIVGLFLLGLIARLGGLFFNGMADLYQILLEWGATVHRDGLVAAFASNYGILSYALFGPAVSAAEAVPRFWWAPYKLVILGFDIAVLAALLRLVPPERRTLTLALYWLNPWFVLHEAYHGFWEAPHVLFGLLAVLAAAAVRRPATAWTLVGGALACSAMFKPQGLLHFVAPVGLYLTVQAVRGTPKPLGSYLLGISMFVAGVALWLRVAGGSAFALVENYRSALSVMSGISNGGPGLWRFVAYVYMTLTGQAGHVAFLRMPWVTIAALSAVAGGICLAILIAFAVRVRLGDERRVDLGRVVLLVLTLGSLTLSQFGARAHINHSFTGMVLLVPFVVADREMRRLWVVMSLALGSSHLLIYGLGHPALLPPEEILSRYPAAASLIARVVALPAYATPDWPLRMQQSVARAVANVPGETIVSLLSAGVFVTACLMVRALFRIAGSPHLR